MWIKTREQASKIAIREYEKKMTADIKHEDQTNAASRGHLLLQWQEWHMAADGKGCAREDCHSVRGIWTWYLCLFVCSHDWQKGNTQYACVWKHFPFSTPQGLGSSHSFKQWPFFQFWLAIFSHPVEFLSPTLPAHAVCLHMQHWWCMQQEGVGMCPDCPAEGTGGSCIRCEMSQAPLWQAANATPGA